MAGTGSKAIVVVFNFHFDMVSGALLGPAQALNMTKRRHNM